MKYCIRINYSPCSKASVDAASSILSQVSGYDLIDDPLTAHSIYLPTYDMCGAKSLGGIIKKQKFLQTHLSLITNTISITSSEIYFDIGLS